MSVCFPGVNSPFQSSSWRFLPVFLPSCFPVPFTVSYARACVCCRCVLSTLGPDAAYLDDSHCHSISTTRLSSMQPGEGASANLLPGFGHGSQSSPSLVWSDSHSGQSESSPTITGAVWPMGCVQRADGLRRGDSELSSGSAEMWYKRFWRDELWPWLTQSINT